MAGCLDGIKVLDMGRYQAGPRCAMMLGDLGAEVVKLEAPGGDESRGIGKVTGRSITGAKRASRSMCAASRGLP